MKLFLGAAVAVVVGVGVFGVVMQPTTPERVAIGLIFSLMAATALAAALWLPRLARGNRSLRTTVMTLSVVSFSIVVFGLLAAGQQMFISSHDLTLLLIVIGFGVVAAVAFAFLVSGPLTGELAQISRTASAIASGDLSMRTSIGRSDEVGELATAIDEMAEALEESHLDREKNEDARRELFAAIGHDLRTPLASLQAALEAVQDGMTDDPERYVDSMRRDSEALSRLVDDLFLLARLDSGAVAHELEFLDLTEIADEAVEVLQPICDGRDITIHLEMEDRVKVSATHEGLSRVLRNLLDNAVRHSPRGGRVVVGVHGGSEVRVEISDQGEGFSEGFIDHAFDRFSRQSNDRSRSSGGAGLGLAIASRYIDEFGGAIWAEPGPGGRVVFNIPAEAGLREPV